MTNPRYILGAVLVACWALLLAAHFICAAILRASTVGNAGVSELGWLLPICTWSSLVAGIALFLLPKSLFQQQLDSAELESRFDEYAKKNSAA